jgi:microcystin-dependent protein
VVNPRTVNAGIIVPLTGADVDLWGELDVNPNMVAIDGFIAGVQTIAVSNAPVTLSAPAGFTPTPTPGPTQAQNRVLKFTGTLTADVMVTLPTPGMWVIDNTQTVAGAFVLKFQGTTPTQVIAAPPGEVFEIYNDGANVRFVGLGRIGTLEFWGGAIAMPRWVTECTVKPYLYADGSIVNTADYPTLAARYGSQFGGNGLTTFGVQDLRGRYPLAYDGTGGRVTVAQCGINGQQMGAAADAQSVTLNINQMPSHYHVAGIYDPSHSHSSNGTGINSSSTGGGGFTIPGYGSVTINAASTGIRVNSSNGLDTTYSQGGGGSHNNMPNTQVAGIWVVKT